ncbi:hypothetical protein PV08_11063 [Exophiala spinifera]|uniref:Ketoreductase (KR) domain-containing protein n=1 Tax=Exophiala spinifera TaxID=91928 RepID=A0A0D2ATQ2_9EURO|nr:uncharacterized protein PV08_11063 [Exophiala spinifera]KIW10103.1 hypothetical protein PV08_11063 [Exophiala spinifera]
MGGTVLITGANGTLGLEFIRALLESYPQYTVVGSVRNPSTESDPNTANLGRIIKEHPGAKVHIQALDLGKLAEVRSFTDQLSAQIDQGQLPPLSAIVCNAAAWSLESGLKLTSDGLEATFQVAHLSHYLLVLKLLGSMDLKSARVVMLGSITHYPEKANPMSAFRPEIPEDIEILARPKPDQPGEAQDRGYQRYGTAKLCNVTFMHDLNKRLLANPHLSSLTAVAMDPGGLAASRAQAEQKKTVRRIMAVVNFCMPLLKHLTQTFRPTADAARDLVEVSVGAEFVGKRGYYVGRKAGDSAAMSRDPEVQTRLWNACWKWSGLESDETVF